MTTVNRNAAVNAVGERLPGQADYNKRELARLREEAQATADIVGKIAPNLKDTQYLTRVAGADGESLLRGQVMGATPFFTSREVSSAQRALLHSDAPFSSVEYFNRKLQLEQLKPEQLEQVMIRGFGGDIDSALFQSTPKHSPTGYGPINPFLIGANADFDGNALNDFVPPPPPIPGFPIDELVNLPRFIMEDVAPFAFVNEPQYKPTNLRLPYPKMLFELGPPDARHLVVVTQRGTHGFDFSTEYLHQDKETPFEIGAMSHVDLSHGDILEVHQMVYQTDPAVAEWTLMAIIGFIAEYGIGNTIIGTQARDPNRVIPPAGSTRKYRIVRLIMGVTKVCKPWQGGTHASPREHERMGHWRRVKGEPRWFPAVTVNKGVIGRVMKAYHVSKKTSSPATQGPEA